MEPENDIDFRMECTKLTAKVNRLERDIFKKDLELLILKDERFNHIDYSTIDEDGIDMLMISFKKNGWDSVKLWLLRMYPTPAPTFQPRIRMLSDVLAEIDGKKK